MPDSFQVHYAADLNIADSVVNLTNNGASATAAAGGIGFASGNLCVSIYAFDPSEEMLSCCSCTVTPNGLQRVSVYTSLVANSLTGEHPSSVMIKLIATDTAGATCNATTPVVPGGTPAFASGLLAWGTTLHKMPTSKYALTETPFEPSNLSEAEYNHLVAFCAFITPSGVNPGFGGRGVCASCQTGALGASTEL